MPKRNLIKLLQIKDKEKALKQSDRNYMYTKESNSSSNCGRFISNLWGQKTLERLLWKKINHRLRIPYLAKKKNPLEG